jgi:hypothetical protein
LKKFTYNQDKNIQLKSQRGISFEELIWLINHGHLIDILEHPNQDKYQGQSIFVIDVEEYIWLVPFVENEDEIFLKTAFPSRKHSKKYLEDKNGQ